MKDFLNNYSYSAVKMFVNQFAISIFGAMLSMATTVGGNDTISIVVSIFAILFYLVLIYMLTWEVGAKDRISVDIGKKKKNVHRGILIAAIANIPNLLLALVYSIGYPFMNTYSWAGNTCAIVRLISILLQGMYLGLTTSVTVGASTINFYPITYFVVMIPAMLTAWMAYALGFNNKKITTIFSYQSLEKTSKK